MEIRDNSENPHSQYSRAWYEVQDQLFEVFMARAPENRIRLREMVAADGGPELDLSIESLDDLGEWFVDWARRDPDDGEAWWSVTVSHQNRGWSGVGPTGRRDLSFQMERMRDRIAVYLGDVVTGLVPGSDWVCWRGDHVGDLRGGDIVVDVGDPRRPFDVTIFPGRVVMAAYAFCFDESRASYRPPEPDAMGRDVVRMLAQLEKRREEGLMPEFQPAPTGPEAKGRKRPHSGRRIFEALQRDGVY
ncbi:MAG: hypothetical protein LBK95_04000 [Bifidobacteriaceae bacterium]|nr:hypothetical protein [Bifidobacteriaceae bacterium]